MKIVNDHPDETGRRPRRRTRVLRTVAVLPSLATLGNLVCGLGAIYMCLLSIQAAGADLHAGGGKIQSLFPTYLAIGAYLLVIAMMFDGIDGRLARLTRKTSEFGGQLDSLADIVSFGVAPAMLVLCITYPGNVKELVTWERAYWRAEWVMAAVYVCCAALRLARFNVENEEDESAHMGFRGLPTPGAAAAIIGMVIFHQDLLKAVSSLWCDRVAIVMPPTAMILGLLMVSRIRYVHLVNVVLRGRRPFGQVVVIVILVLIGLVVQFQLTIAAAALAYALAGPVGALVRRIRARRHPGEVDNDDAQDGESIDEPDEETGKAHQIL